MAAALLSSAGDVDIRVSSHTIGFQNVQVADVTHVLQETCTAC